jgi:hypothetical protein
VGFLLKRWVSLFKGGFLFERWVFFWRRWNSHPERWISKKKGGFPFCPTGKVSAKRQLEQKFCRRANLSSLISTNTNASMGNPLALWIFGLLNSVSVTWQSHFMFSISMGFCLN